MRWRILLGLVLGGGVAVALWWGLRPQQGRVLHLPDGREVRLMAVTYGTEHRFVQGRLLARIGAPVIPAKWRKKVGLTVAELKSDVPTLMVWVQWRGGDDSRRDITDASVFDEHGWESEPVRSGSTIYLFDRPWGTVRGWQFASFPRRDKTIGVRLYARGAAYNPDRMAEFSFPNPAPRDYPVWSGPPLPQTKRDGEWEFSLVRLTTGEAIPDRLKPARGWIAPWTSAAFRVTQNGEPSDAWTVASIQATDASGNVVHSTVGVVTNGPGGLVFGFGAALWAAEPAWKLAVEFSRTEGFSETELVLLKDVPVPPREATTNIDKTFLIQGARLTVRNLERPVGSYGFYGKVQPNATLTCLLVPAEGVRLRLLRAIDDRGLDWGFITPAWPPPAGFYTFRFEVPKDARTVDLTFGVTRSLYVEFLARPEFIGTNSTLAPR